MCLILFALDCHPDYKLVVAANRDEFYARPSLPAAYWENEPSLLAGKDLSHNGTWLGITSSGRFSAITNYRNPAVNREDAPSRGKLVYNYLHTDPAAEEYIRQVTASGNRYNGYSLLLGTQDSLYYHSNQSKKEIVKVEKGIHGLSNSLLDVPWRKVWRGREKLASVLSGSQIEVRNLFELLSDSEPAPDSELPHTGVPIEAERMLSPIFLKSPDYGTCVSTVLLIDRSNRVRFWERSFGQGTGEVTGEVFYEFQIQQ